MGRAARRHHEQTLNGNDWSATQLESSWSLSPGTMLGAIVVGVALLLFLGYTNWELSRQIERGLDGRLAQIENRLAQLSTKVEQVGSRAAAGAQRGPDPDRVYTIKADGAPSKGSANAPVTIAEFSDFQ
jgi:hypothetical protein